METQLTAPLPAVVNGHAIANYEERSASLPMPLQIERIVERVDAVKEIVRKVFEDEVHFGVIPGTGTKKTLLKPGFDALCLAFQFSPEFIKQPESIETDKMINLVYKCRIIHSATGKVIATGDGSCNSKEEKYRWTTTARACPICKKETIIKGREEYGGGWLCFEKKGGCKAKFKDGDKAIEGQTVGRIENDNPWNFHNTLTKMAQKRAGMAAIITACGLSGDFTQDMEDFEPQNDKRQRQEADAPQVDIQAQYQPERPFYQEELPYNVERNESQFGGESADFTPVQPAPQEPATPTMPDDVLAAFRILRSELKLCSTKDHFHKLKAFMQSKGGVYLDERVKNQVNARYAELFPAKPKSQPATGATSVPAAP